MATEALQGSPEEGHTGPRPPISEEVKAIPPIVQGATPAETLGNIVGGGPDLNKVLNPGGEEFRSTIDPTEAKATPFAAPGATIAPPAEQA